MAITLDGTNGGTASAGWYAKAPFTGTYTDGIVVDYTTGMGRISVGSSDGVAFYNGGVATTELMRLTSAGYLGIGTSSPASPLHVESTTTPQFKIVNTGVITWGLSAKSDTNLGIVVNSTEVGTWSSSGNLGLGVTPSGWGSAYGPAIDMGTAGSIAAYSTAGIAIYDNSYINSSAQNIYKTTAAAAKYQMTTGIHYWYTAPSGTAGNAISFTQAMTLDASGKLGVGSTSPQFLVSASQNSGTGAPSIQVTPQFYAKGYAGAGQQYAGIGFAMYEHTNGYWGSGILAYDDTGSYGSALAFYTSTGSATPTPTERARIDSSGNLLVGTTSGITGGSGLYRMVISANGTNLWGVGPYSTAPSNFYVSNNGNIGVYLAYGNTSWTANSDERLKTDLKPIENAVQKVLTLRAVTGRYIADEEGVSRSFLIAQDVQSVLPEAVDTSDPDKLGVQYTDTIPLLVAAIKELSAELNELKQKVNA